MVIRLKLINGFYPESLRVQTSRHEIRVAGRLSPGLSVTYQLIASLTFGG
jgi:hypothetical protein